MTNHTIRTPWRAKEQGSLSQPCTTHDLVSSQTFLSILASRRTTTSLEGITSWQDHHSARRLHLSFQHSSKGPSRVGLPNMEVRWLFLLSLNVTLEPLCTPKRIVDRLSHATDLIPSLCDLISADRVVMLGAPWPLDLRRDQCQSKCTVTCCFGLSSVSIVLLESQGCIATWPEVPLIT